jgi:AbrB family looped-hinge helix DNA binding protein
MSSATVTSKGQITVPKEVRDDLGLRAGSRVRFVKNDQGIVELHQERRPVTVDCRAAQALGWRLR